jgi:hypothetical protein
VGRARCRPPSPVAVPATASITRAGYARWLLCWPLPRAGNGPAQGALGFLCCAKAKGAGTCSPSAPWPWQWSSSSSSPCAVDVVLCHRSRGQEPSSVIGSFEGQNSVQFCPISVQDHFSTEGQKSVQFCPSSVQVLSRTTFLPEMDASQRRKDSQAQDADQLRGDAGGRVPAHHHRAA